MKKIMLEISDRVFEEIKSSIIIKQMSGNMYGVMDEAVYKILKLIDEGAESVTLKYKDEEGND